MTQKTPVNLWIDADLAREAHALGTNVSTLLERALREEHRAFRSASWQDEDERDTSEARFSYSGEAAESGWRAL